MFTFESNNRSWKQQLSAKNLNKGGGNGGGSSNDGSYIWVV